MGKRISIKAVQRDEFDLDLLSLALLSVAENLDEATLQALALDGQAAIERLHLPMAHLPRRKSAA